MRFLVNINLIDNNIPYSIPTDYRRHVSSLIKEAINIVSRIYMKIALVKEMRINQNLIHSLFKYQMQE